MYWKFVKLKFLGKISLDLPYKIVLNGSKLKSGSPNFNQNAWYIHVLCLKFSWRFDLFILFNHLSWFNHSRSQLTYVQNTSHDLSALVPRTDKRLIFSYLKKKSCKILVVIFGFSIQLVFKRVNTSLASLVWFMIYLTIHFNITLRYFNLCTLKK